MYKNLIVLGNGFDLHNGLKSDFGSFFEYRKSELKNVQKFVDEVYKDLDYSTKSGEVGNFESLTSHTLFQLRDDIDDWGYRNYLEYTSIDEENICFWDFYLLFVKMEKTDWNDIEGQLRKFFVRKNPELGKSRFENMQEYFNEIINIQRIGYLSDESKHRLYRSQIQSVLNYDHKTQALIFVAVNIFGFDGNSSLNKFLMDQLHKFEEYLRLYLNNQVQESSEYIASTEKCIDWLKDGTECNILNFNYTTVPVSHNETERNIHGSLLNNPIIGIDANKILAEKPYFNFTKTFRIMNLANGSVQSILPGTPQKIIFYGHSLSEPDYSYFQSIFDYYDIYGSKIKLVFCYSEYPGHSKDTVAQEQYKRVGLLLDSYGRTIPNHGKNLLHKLLLENRISFNYLE